MELRGFKEGFFVSFLDCFWDFIKGCFTGFGKRIAADFAQEPYFLSLCEICFDLMGFLVEHLDP